MSWPKRIAALLAIVIPVAVTATLLYRARARQIAAHEAEVAAAKQRLEELAPVQKMVDDFQRRKADYEARVAAIERLRSAPSPRTLVQVASTAESFGVVIEEMTLAGMALTVTFRVPTAVDADRFRAELEKRGLAASTSLQAGEKGRHTLNGTLVPATPEPTAAP